MKPEWKERADRLDLRLDKHIEFVAKSFVRLDKKLDRHIESTAKNFDRLDKKLDQYIEATAKGFAEVRFEIKKLTKQVTKVSIAQEETERRLQRLINHVDRKES